MRIRDANDTHVTNVRIKMTLCDKSNGKFETLSTRNITAHSGISCDLSYKFVKKSLLN